MTDLHERLARVEERIKTIADTLTAHVAGDAARDAQVVALREHLGNLTFGGRLLLRTFVGLLMLGGTVFAAIKFLHAVLHMGR